MERTPARILSALMGLSFLLIGAHSSVFAQQKQVKRWGISGQYDPEILPPAIEGKPGQKDSSAVKEIREFVTGTTPGGWLGIQSKGILIVGGGQAIREFPASLVVEKGAKYRLDIQAGSEESSVRVDGRVGARRQPEGSLQQMQVSELGGPFFLPSELWEIANHANVSVIDDGVVMVERQSMHKITLVLPTMLGDRPSSITNVQASALTLYFDRSRHYLLKKVEAGHYPGNSRQQYLQVTTYNDYRKIQGAIVPFVISETNNGQHGMTFKASEISETSQHEASYFHF